MAKKMDALVKKYAKEGLWLEKVDVPVIGKRDVLVKMKKTAICGTDVHIYNWDEWSKATIPVPMTIGHEFVGEIVEVGEEVSDYKVGDTVSGEGHVVCGHCRNCLAGRRHLCENTQGIGVNRTGIFAEYAVIPMTNVWLVDGDIDEDIVSIFDPLGNAVHTALSFDLVGEDVLITGAGPIGMMAAAVAKHAGARYVVVTDVNDYRLGLAKELGATRIMNPMKEKLEDVMKELGMKEGFDVGLEMSGNASALNTMIENMSHGGKIAMLGIQGPDTRVDWNKIVFNGLHIKGIYGREMFETWYKMTAMIESGLDVSKVITHKMHYTKFQEGFDIMRTGKSGKVILEW
ncbi:L-threonine 3-dehydrogenase [Helicovermis profundi]|uniref:L-threonine 3-dehydrogenase n=1 Tax=Helicovermis profundi TaxID=3065157 RepID=A0AAU9EE39_9FIRM|nr:L-threonine 3-dehydrogenase [Clostridia bacterium S502]